MPQRKRRQYGYVSHAKHAQKHIHTETSEKLKKRSSSGPHLARLIGGLLGLALMLIKVPFLLIRRLGSLGVARLARLAVVAGVVGGVLLLLMFVWVSRDLPDPDKLTDRTVAQSTKIYDRTGEHILFEVFEDQKRTLVSLDDIPQSIVDGVIATEDTQFYEHRGIRPLSLLRSFAYGLVGKGRIGGGASTLTQQLVKNAILSPEQTITRKMKELILSVRLEQKYTKDQILQIYFNEIPYGSTNYGIQSAAQSYFGKNVQNLTLAEGAVLAGMPKAPTRYLNNNDALKQRRDFVLKRMFDEGYITEEEKNAAQAEPLTLQKNFGSIQAPHFVLYVKEQLVEKYGEQAVASGGLRVISSLDWDMQQAAEEAVREESETLFEEAGANNTALVALDPKNGQIRALVGSRDFEDDDIDGQFNVAVLARRQPGSSFKPIIYAAAFEKGFTPDTILFDVKTNFAVSGKPYIPLNYDLQEHGPVSVRQALQGSLNIPAVKALYLVGDKKGVEFAERLGYSSLKANNFGLSLVLGGGEVQLLEHVNAFATFANGGLHFAPVSILRVESADGEVLEEWKQTRGDRVLEEPIANTMSQILSDDGARAYAFGAGGVLTLKDRPVAAKTGTTNGYVDAWTVGYTPSLVAGVWAGNTNNSPMKRGYGGSRVAAPIWNHFMREALKDTPAESFPPGPANDAEKPALRGSSGGNITLLVDKVTGKRATSSTPEQFIVERTYTQAHSILHYVDKDDPRGPIPERPEQDPQYAVWEAAIQDWIARKKAENPDWDIRFEDPPNEFDDSHALELIPSLEVVYPSPSTTIHSRQIDTDIRVSAPRGVSKVTYKIDEQYVGVVRSHPFNLSYSADRLAPGAHTLTILVEDDVGNQLEQQIPFILDAQEARPSVGFSGTGDTLSTGSFPVTLFLSPYKAQEMQSVSVTAHKDGTTLPVATVTDFANLFNGNIPITWSTAPDEGTWQLRTRITLRSGETLSGGEKTVRVTQ